MNAASQKLTRALMRLGPAILPFADAATVELPLGRGKAGHRGTFARAPRHTGIQESVWASGAAAADLDNDGFVDVYVTAIGSNRLYRNNGDGTFSVWDAGVEDDHFGTGAAFVEWSRTGQLDLYLVNYIDFDGARTATLGDGVCHYLGIEVFCGPIGLRGDRDVLFLSGADGTFQPSDDPAVDPDSLYGFAALPFDCDGQAPAELYVANDSNTNLLYRLTESGLEDLSLLSGAGFSAGGMEQAGMGLTSADYDGDGDFDLLVTNFQHDYNTLYENLGDCTFIDVTADRGLAAAAYPYMGWAPLFLDIDGDGDQDLFVANGHLYPQIAGRGLEPFGQRNLLFLNRLRETGAPAFDEVGAQAGAGLQLELTSRTAVAADYDNDGDLDLLITHMDVGPELLANETTMRFPSLTLTLIGRSANRSALGSVVRVKSGGLEQWLELHRGDGYLGTNDARLVVYLPGGQAQELEIRWPDGGTTLLHEVASGTVVIDQERGVIARAPERPRALDRP